MLPLVITKENVASASELYATMTEMMAPMLGVGDLDTAAAVLQDIVDLEVTDMEVRPLHATLQ